MQSVFHQYLLSRTGREKQKVEDPDLFPESDVEPRAQLQAVSCHVFFHLC